MLLHRGIVQMQLGLGAVGLVGMQAGRVARLDNKNVWVRRCRAGTVRGGGDRPQTLRTEKILIVLIIWRVFPAEKEGKV